MSDDRTVIVRVLQKNRRENLKIAQAEWTPPDNPGKTLRFIDVRIFTTDDDRPTGKGIRIQASMTQGLIGALEAALDWSGFDFPDSMPEEAPAAEPEGEEKGPDDDVPF